MFCIFTALLCWCVFICSYSSMFQIVLMHTVCVWLSSLNVYLLSCFFNWSPECRVSTWINFNNNNNNNNYYYYYSGEPHWSAIDGVWIVLPAVLNMPRASTVWIHHMFIMSSCKLYSSLCACGLYIFKIKIFSSCKLRVSENFNYFHLGVVCFNCVRSVIFFCRLN